MSVSLPLDMIYAHEHMFLDLSSVKKDPDTVLDDSQATLDELKTLKEKGVGCVVDVTNIGMGRQTKKLIELEKASGLTICASTGYYYGVFIPSSFLEHPLDKAVSHFIEEITKGIEGTNKRATFIGEIGTAKEGISEAEQKVFEASILAHKETNAPIITHAALGQQSEWQTDFFLKHGVDPRSVTISHLDLCPHEEEVFAVGKKGFYIGIDTIGKIPYATDEARADRIQKLCQKGFEDQILLSTDITRKSQLKAHGGYGYSHLLDVFIPLLYKQGLTENQIEKFLVHNPKKRMEK